MLIWSWTKHTGVIQYVCWMNEWCPKDSKRLRVILTVFGVFPTGGPGAVEALGSQTGIAVCKTKFPESKLFIKLKFNFALMSWIFNLCDFEENWNWKCASLHRNTSWHIKLKLCSLCLIPTCHWLASFFFSYH